MTCLNLVMDVHLSLVDRVKCTVHVQQERDLFYFSLLTGKAF